jgi:hypothetical protein
MILNRDPSPRDLRVFGLLLVPVTVIAGIVAQARFDAPTVARGIWASGAALVVLYAAIPPARRPIFVGWSALGFPVGWLLSHVVLGLVFWLVITPIAVALRLLGQDPLDRRADPTVRSYWSPHRAAGDVDRYFRQH